MLRFVDRYVFACAAVAAMFSFSGCGPIVFTEYLVSDDLTATYVVRNAVTPGGIALAADGRVFYIERTTGLIRVIRDDQLLETPFASVPVNYAGEWGGLAVAVHPEFDRKPRIYVFYTRSDTGEVTNNPVAVLDQRVVYFEAAGDVAAGGEVFIAAFPVGPSQTRVGGKIALDSRGSLFVGMGDGGEPGNAQDPATLLGQLLRYDDDGGVPADNPTAGSPVFASGFRDVRGVVIDTITRLPILCDQYDGNLAEINVVHPGRNYGWPNVVGAVDTDAERAFAESNPAYAEPLHVFTDMSDAAGIWVNSSGQFGPDARNSITVGDGAGRSIRQIRTDGNRQFVRRAFVWGSEYQGDIHDHAFSPSGTLWVAPGSAFVRVTPFR